MREDKHLERLAERLRRLRIRRGWKQRDLAAAAGVAASTVARYERGSDEPTLGTLIKLAHALETTVSYLIGEADAGIPAQQVGAETATLSRDLQRITAALDRLSDVIAAHQREIARLADAVEALQEDRSNNTTHRSDPSDSGTAAG